MREVATKSDNFELTFPLDLNVKYKAVLLGTCFLIVSIPITFWKIVELHFLYILGLCLFREPLNR